jgi:hypothetical protein
MAVLATLHVDQQYLSKQVIGSSCLGASGNLGFEAYLTNTTVAAADTNSGLQTAVMAAAGLHADEQYGKARVNVGIQLGSYSGELSDARILGLTTTTELVGLTYASVSQSVSYPPE